MKFHCLYGDVPARLPAICAVAFVPAASTGWYEDVEGLSSMPLSRAWRDGGWPALDGSVVKPEWHFRQIWYSRVGADPTVPFRNV